jgi:crotonobetainyl-CoA:carnitine CoA-transferase CaiB-like acyl-CoA transferase
VTSGMLSGITILDMTTVIFGPYCTATLAAMGAEVTKIEPAAGDEARRVGRPVKTRGMGPLHMTLNEGKKSVVLDLKSPKGKLAIAGLIRGSDVFIHSLRQPAVERLGLDYPDAARIRPDLVYVHCTGFGSEGPYAGRPAYDDIIQAASGAASLLPRVDGDPRPRYLPTALADKVAGLHAVYAVLAALFHRERTGEGQRIEVPMFEAVTHFLMQEHLYGQTFVPHNGPIGYPRQLDADRQPMRTQDGYISVAPYTDDRWVRFFDVTGSEDFLRASGLETPRLRVDNLSVLHAQMAKILAERPTAAWLVLLSDHDIPAVQVNNLEDLTADPHLQAVGFFQRKTHSTEGEYVSMAPPVRFSSPAKPMREPPSLGQHTNEVLRDLDS